MKQIYLIRHCEAEGQSPEAPLTEKGFKQAIDLADFFEGRKVERMISSPFTRAFQTIQPLADQLNMEIETNHNLSERILSTTDMPDWYEKLKLTFENFDVRFEGGESSNEAANRIVAVMKDVFNSDFNHTIIVTHGGILALLLNHLNKNYGFDEWATLSNPDVYLVTFENNEATFERIWRK